MLEITPACDYAAGKTEVGRLLGGMLVQSARTRTGNSKRMLPEKSRTFAKQTEFFLMRNSTFSLDGVYSLVVNARHLHTKPRAEMASHTPVFRLRHQIVADIRAWFAAHAARPGYVGLR